jgi:hypothetical protein
MVIRFKGQKTPAESVTVFAKRLRYILFRFAAILVLGGAFLALEFILIDREVAKLQQSRAAVSWATKTSNVLLELSQGRPRATELEARLGEVLPSSIEIPAKIIPAFRALGATLNVRADIQIGTENPAGADTPGSVGISLRADGSMGALLKFLQAIERETFAVRLESVSINPLDQPGNIRQLTANGKIYIR